MMEQPPPVPDIEEGTAPVKGRTLAVVCVLFTLLLDVMSLGLITPVLPDLIRGFTGASSDAGIWAGGLIGAWALMQFIFQPVVGALSDRYGRRPIILASNFGNGIDYLVMGFAPTIWWLLAGRAISGITSSSIGTTYAYLADLTPPKKRAGAFGLLGAVFGLGFLLGPGVGGLLGDPNGELRIPQLHIDFHFHGDPRLPFFVAGGLSLLNVLLGFVVLPESLPRERRERFRWRRANPWAAFRLLQSHPDLLPLAGVQLIALCANYALLTLFPLYVRDRFHWTAGWRGLTLVIMGACAGVVQAVLTGVFAKVFGERITVAIALACGAVGFAIFGLATTSNAFVIGVPITTLWGMAAAASQSLMSHRVAPWEQGKLQGANMGLSSIAGLIAPLSFGWIYSQFTGPLARYGLPGAPFVAAAVALVLALVLALLAGKAAKQREAVEPSP
jgi:DHA1 family tetracycline resistance protein-like MFS transporter